MLQSGQVYLLIYDGTAFQLQTPQVGGIVASSLGPNGYRIWSNGQIDQWGSVSLAVSGTSTIGSSLTFPIAFPNAVWSLTGNADDGATSGWAPLVIMFPSTTLTGSNISADSTNSAQPISAGRNVRWMATGN